jgi:L-ascorbate metabolism protein UlaG (beta-lactamase superfamily)
VAALPIGAYAPSYFMNVSHAHPTEAVKIHQDLHVDKSIAIHWGTFALSEEAHDEPPRLLEEASREAGVDFVAVSQGECIVGPEYEEEEERVMEKASETEESQQDERIEYG